MKFRHFCTLPRQRDLLCVALLLALLAATFAVRAAEVGGLYQAAVTVTSRDDERQRQQAFATAMREVLIKLSGLTDSTSNPLVARALSAPQSFVETWAYNSIIPEDPFAQPGQPAQIQLQVSFFQAAIQQLLNDAGIAIWPQNRPDTLVWIAVQDELGERYRATPEAEQGADLIAAVESEATRRGVPVLLPLLDFADLRALPLEPLWNLDVNALRIASSRYQGESILALRVYRSLSGDVIARAVYIFRDQVREFDALESPLEPFIASSIDLVAQNLASYYSIRLSGGGNDSSSTQEVLLTIEGVDSASDYAGLLNYLNGLAVVSKVQVLGAQRDALELGLSTGGQSRQLIEVIALDRRLNAMGELTRNGEQLRMHYRWSPQP